MSGGLHIERPKPKTGGLNLVLGNGTKVTINKPEPAPAPAPVEQPKPEPTPKPAEPEPKPVEKPKPIETPKPKPQPVESAPQPAENPEITEEEEEEEVLEIVDESTKKHLNIEFIGHVDAGKSTLCGHVLVLAGIVEPRVLEKYQREAQALGRASWYYSWVMDLAESERAKGKTEEVGVATFETDVNKYTILDAPGHRSYVPQMISGAVQADVAVLVISARTGEFEAGFNGGGQTNEHLLIAKTAGVRYVIIVVNKMDEPQINWSKERYDHIIKTFTPFITKEISFKENQFCYIPIAALSGGNIKDRAPECSWYKGPTLFEALDQVPLPPRNEVDAFRLPVIDRYKTKSLIASGKIEKGLITDNTPIIVMPSGVKGVISGIFVEETKIRRAVPGDNIRISLRGIEMNDIGTGSVICKETDPCHIATKAICKIKLTPSLNGDYIITGGFEAVLHIHTDLVQVKFEKLVEVKEPGKRQPTKNPKFVKPGDFVTAILGFDHPVCIETYADFPQLGRFIIRHNDATIGVGVVEKLPKAKPAA